MTFKARAIIGLVGLSVVDIVFPIPIVGLIMIFVVLQKPPWFLKVVRELYEV